jgi:cysteine-rich repeat protein
MRALLFASCLASGCVTPAATFTCATGAECPGGTCEADGFCSFPDGTCDSGSRYGDGSGDLSNTCVAATAACGNGMIESGEDCEDGNADATDFCVDCKLAACGDGAVLANIEDCDDGNTIDGDGCNANCLDCGPGGVTNPENGHCYSVVATPTDWNTAGGDCLAKGGYLATISDAAENAFVQALIPSPDDHWIGLADFSADNYFWEDSFRLGAFTNFDMANGEPSTAAADEVVAMGQDGLWDVQSEANAHPYICEKHAWTIDAMTQHAYLTIAGRGRATAAGAETACAALSAHLVTIADQPEQDLVDAITGATQTYLGLDDVTTEGTYEWVDGSPFGFFAWGGGEPDGIAADTEDCVALREDGTWIDRVCAGFAIAFVCELDPS